MTGFDCSDARRAVKPALTFVATLALALSASIGAAATGASALDPTFGVGGMKIFDLVAGPDDDIGFGAVQPDGKLVVAG